MAMNGAPFSVNRCFVFGYLFPVNSKNADAGTRHRLLLAKLRPVRTEVEHGPRLRLSRREAKAHGDEFDLLAGLPHHRTFVSDPDVVRLAKVEFVLLGGDLKRNILHQALIFRPRDVLLVIVTHSPFSSVPTCRILPSRPERNLRLTGMG
jgi:hypothetical protein